MKAKLLKKARKEFIIEERNKQYRIKSEYGYEFWDSSFEKVHKERNRRILAYCRVLYSNAKRTVKI